MRPAAWSASTARERVRSTQARVNSAAAEGHPSTRASNRPRPATICRSSREIEPDSSTLHSSSSNQYGRSSSAQAWMPVPGSDQASSHSLADHWTTGERRDPSWREKLPRDHRSTSSRGTKELQELAGNLFGRRLVLSQQRRNADLRLDLAQIDHAGRAVAQVLFKAGARLVEQDALVHFAQAQRLADLFRGATLDVAELDHCALSLGKPIDRFAHLLHGLPREQALVRPWLGPAGPVPCPSRMRVGQELRGFDGALVIG